MIIHVGLPRTATTTFQSVLFPKHPGIRYLGHGGDAFANAVLFESDEAFSAEQQRSRLRALLAGQPSKTGVAVLSNEAFSNSAGLCERTAGRLRAVCGDLNGPPRILLVLRRQQDLMKSYYLYLVRLMPLERPFLPYAQWLRKEYGQVEDPAHNSTWLKMDYGRQVDAYASVFGRENVGLLLFEDLKTDWRHFAERVLAFMGLPWDGAVDAVGATQANPAMGRPDYALRQAIGLLPHCVGRALWPVARVPLKILLARLMRPGKPQLDCPAEWEARIREIAAEGNRRIEESYGLPLSSHGYYT